MQSPNPLSLLSPGQKPPRAGQVQTVEAIGPNTTKLNIKLPTGYGKTFTAMWAYSLLKSQGRVNRLLIIFPSTNQIEQFKRDGEADLRNAGVKGPLKIVDISFASANAIVQHRDNACQVFVITVQSLIGARGADNCRQLLATGCWMVCVDEYHHYGNSKSWGLSVLNLPYAFLLAMSATPTRPTEDSAFGMPDIRISYQEAADEKAVKPLKGHAYAYKIDAIMANGDVKSFTTNELVNDFGTSDPTKVEKVRIERRMRWSPKYVSPLVAIPIERMLRERCATGHKLQALVSAMCVSHAEMVCRQLSDMFPELSIEWVGTGDNGRPADVNEGIVRRFCPPKNDNGIRAEPSVDVLVHVGIAGEGLDSTNVSEVIHLNNATLCNKRLQENGRAARALRAGDGSQVVGHINFDSSSEFAAYTGDDIMKAMDEKPPSVNAPDGPGDPDEPRDLPDEPMVINLNLELLYVDSGDPQVQAMFNVMRITDARKGTLDYDALASDLSHPGWSEVIDIWKLMRAKEAEKHNEESTIKQLQSHVDNATGSVAHRVAWLSTKSGVRFDRSLIGDVKRRINTRKKMMCGQMANDIQTARRHWDWIKKLDDDVKANGVPQWLLS